MAKPPRCVFTAAMRLASTCCALSLLMLSLWLQVGATQSSVPDNAVEQKTPDTSAKPTTKAKKIWTNDDLGPSSPTPETTTRSVGRSSDAAVFLTPRDGDIVQPGDLLHVGISVMPGKVNGPVAIVSEIGVSNEIRQSPPYSFTMIVSRNASVGAGSPLIGVHQITAFGKLEGQEEYGLAAIGVDVEERGMPTKLSMRSNMRNQYGPPGASFYEAGQQDHIAIYANFPNGDEFDVINSSYLKLVSGNPNVANLAKEGWLTSTGPGKTTVTATYTFLGQTLQLSFPVSVSVPRVGLILNPLSLDFGDQPVGSWSNPLEVVLTNRSSSTIKIYAPEIRAAARESDDCTASPLPPGGSCTMSVTFLVVQAGRSQGIIYIPNSQSGLISLPVFGNGI